MDTAKRHSKKRDAILSALRSTDTHPSAEQLYAALKPDYPDLSLGTVYRNLALFLQEGDAIKVATVDGQDRFDGDTGCHAHLICTACGRVFDLDISTTADEQIRLCARDCGFTPDNYTLNYSGICHECAAAKNKK